MSVSLFSRSLELPSTVKHVNNCPGCQSEDFKTVGRVGSTFDALLDNSVFNQPQYRVRHCQLCGLYYKSETMSDEELARYYQTIDFAKWEIDGLFPPECEIIRILSSLPVGSTLLDYGCSTGRLLSRLTNKYRCFGLEINQRAASAAASKGLTVISEQSLRNSEALRFDGIVLCDVFEHLPNPTEVLSLLCASLKPSGFLILATGNADTEECQKDISNFWYFRTAEHLSMLSRRYAEFLSEFLKLTLMSWRETSHYEHSKWERVKQRAKSFAYWQFHGEKPGGWAPSLRAVPLMNRAQRWKFPPAITCTTDHVVVGFLKPAK